ncbi:MAG TPA: alkaline phosphatase family protein [Chloroflexota bacterium]|nr:alkaline phosphatase family protein [Chloroflexota bacterium]
MWTVPRAITLCLALAAVLAASAVASSPTPQRTATPIEHLVVIYLENWSFDALYGTFPGADGLTPGPGTPTPLPQAQRTFRAPTPFAEYPLLPRPLENNASNGAIPNPSHPGTPDTSFPTAMPNHPVDLATWVPPDRHTGDIAHRFFNQQYQINGGRMDRFAAFSDNPGLVLTYYDRAGVPTSVPAIAHFAKQYTLADRWFHAAFGDSWLNHFWLLCACTPIWYGATPPPEERVNPTLDPATGYFTQPVGSSIEWTPVPTGPRTWYIVTQPNFTPHICAPSTPTPASPGPTNTVSPAPTVAPTPCVPLQLLPTIGDRLSEKGISWQWYHDEIPGVLPWFEKYATQTPGYLAHVNRNVLPTTTVAPLRRSFLDDLREPGALPAVSFIRPSGPASEHPGETTLAQGEVLVAATLVPAIMTSTPYQQNKVAIVVTYDENGGRWDHVAPPSGTPGISDQFGPGVRVPAIVISPWAKRCFVDHSHYDTTAIIAFIARNWGLPTLGPRDGAISPLTNAFDFTATPLPAGACAPPTGTLTATATPARLTVSEAVEHVRRHFGQTGQAGVHAATRPGDTVAVSGAVSGTGRVTGSMSWTLSAQVPAGVPAGTIPTAVLSTALGLEGFPCAAVTAGATAVTCVGATSGNALQGSLVVVVFQPGVTSVGTVSGPGPRPATAGATPAPTAQGRIAVLPPLQPSAPLLPPLLVPPPPPFAAASVAAPSSELPVIPEADSLALLGAGLIALVALHGLGRGGRRTRR